MVSRPRLLLHQALPDRNAIFAAACRSCTPCFKTDSRHNGDAGQKHSNNSACARLLTMLLFELKNELGSPHGVP
jgi:hypothetical protein